MGVCQSYIDEDCIKQNHSTSEISSHHNRKGQMNNGYTKIQNKDMFDWTAGDVNRWILSVEHSKLVLVADEFKKRKINGLMLMGINEKYLRDKIGITSQEDIDLIISSRDALLNPNQNPSTPMTPSPKSIESNHQLVQPPLKSSSQNAASLDINTTTLTKDNSLLSDNGKDNTIKHEAPPITISITGTNNKNDPQLDGQFLAELVQVGLSGIGLSEHFSKSISHCYQGAILSPRKYDAEPGGNGHNLPGLDDEKQAKQFKKELTKAKLLVAESKLNATAAVWTPDPHQNQYAQMTRMTRTQSAPNPTQHRNKLAKIDEEKQSPTSPLDTTNYDSRFKWAVNNTNEKRGGSRFMKNRAKGKFTISRDLTKSGGIIDSKIKETIPNLFEYMDLSTIIQHGYESKHGDTIRILDYDFHDAQSGEKLYCMVKKNDNNDKWRMDNKLYTSKDIESMNEFHALPKSTREKSKEFQAISQQKQEIEKNLKFKNTMMSKEGIINKEKWHKKCIKIRENKVTNKIRRTLSLTKEEFQERMKQNIGDEEKRDVDLIPIVVFHDHGFRIEYVEIMEITEDVHVGIAYRLNNCIEVTAIYVDKDELKRQHHLVSPQHNGECKCFDSFKTNIDVLYIGNPDDKENQMNALKKRLKISQDRVKELEGLYCNGNNLNGPLPPADQGMSSGSNSPESNADKSVNNGNLNVDNKPEMTQQNKPKSV